MDKRPPLVAVVGATAVGKTEVAIQLAERWRGEIVSADSRLLYRGMDIGTAKPSKEQLAAVPHHLINVAEPDETWGLAVFQQKAANAISEIHSRGRLPILVGGTGQYMNAILQGWQPPALPQQPRLRAALEAWAEEVGKDGLHARLAALDPQAAARIDARNLRRTLRALEVIFSTGHKFSTQSRKSETPYRLLQIGLTRPRQELYVHIDTRIERMLTAGWLDEVNALLVKGYSAELPSLSAIGYRELIRHLQGKLMLDEAVMEIKRATRAFVRRQGAWFKATDPNITWIDLGQLGAEAKLNAVVEAFLS